MDINYDPEVLVSVCVVTYNQKKYIEQCLNSIVVQKTPFLFEVLVGDDASTDGTRNVIEDFAARYPGIIKPILQKINVGPRRNYYAVHERASGEFIAHIDGDDLMNQGKLAKQVTEFMKDPRLVICWHKMDELTDDGSLNPQTDGYLLKFPAGRVTLERALRYGSPGAHSSVMYRRRERPNYFPDEDVLDMFISWRFLEQGNGLILPDTLGIYRTGVGLATTNIDFVRRLSARHASHFLKKYPIFNESIFIFSFFRALIDLRGLRPTFFKFLIIAIKSFKINYLNKIASEYKILKSK